MGGTEYFGYFLVALSAVLLAQHWQQSVELPTHRSPAVRDHLRRQVQRRSVASALIGVIGAAMILVDRVPRNPASLSVYLFALVLGGAVILAIALADLRASRRHRETQQLDMIAQELRKATAAQPNSE